MIFQSIDDRSCFYGMIISRVWYGIRRIMIFSRDDRKKKNLRNYQEKWPRIDRLMLNFSCLLDGVNVISADY